MGKKPGSPKDNKEEVSRVVLSSRGLYPLSLSAVSFPLPVEYGRV